MADTKDLRSLLIDLTGRLQTVISDPDIKPVMLHWSDVQLLVSATEQLAAADSTIARLRHGALPLKGQSTIS
jgi:hypothetical protein